MAADNDRRAARLAKQIGAFAERHGSDVEGQIAYVGEAGFRIALVGADGGWGDLMAPSLDVAKDAVERSGPLPGHSPTMVAAARRSATSRFE